MTHGDSDQPDPSIRAFVGRTGLVADPGNARFVSLEGGVSSDIWLVGDGSRSFCVKRALPRLRVAAEWLAPVQRNLYEAAWLKRAARLVPGSVPEVLADDPDAGMFAMEYLDPGRHRCWKADLLAARVDPAVAEAVGKRLGALHSLFAREPDAPARFATDANFHALRLEPYLLATARAHADLAEPIERLVARTANTKRTVVHGDVSPKNILVGPKGPVFLDAECAWFGDPAFDLAFCLNHLLLKCLAVPAAAVELQEAFRALATAYLAEVDWEDPAEVESRAATLLPGLFLARVDGKSPAEYVTLESSKDQVRRVARRFLKEPQQSLSQVAAVWGREIGSER
jgi:aminoglycoside phosphotransferase (APT) family kinase protein